MNKLSILDCTLRDGGYINKWNFGKETIQGIIQNLLVAGVDIIECGFLRDVSYDENVAVFSCVSQITPFITPKKKNTLYVALLALGDIATEKILPCDGTSIDGIRLAFHRHEWEEAKTVAIDLMKKGYKVFIQPVGTTAYSDLELLHLIQDVNQLQPYSFHLVDTLGIMYRQDLLRLFYLIDHNLSLTIKLGFHSHNNLQLSFANTQELLRQDSKRDLIIDTAVYGMGRGVGNLATELVAEYVNKNISQKYSIIPLLDITDKYLMSIYAEQKWGYDLPYFLSASYKCHPNYAAYLLKKETLDIASISKLLSLLPADKSDLYHKELIEELYFSMQSCQYDDTKVIGEIKDLLRDKNVLLLAPGASLKYEKQSIDDYINQVNPFIISTNFISDTFQEDMIFVSNRKRADVLQHHLGDRKNIIITSNLKEIFTNYVYMINYASYLGEGKASDNAGAMLIRFLKQAGVKKFALAGFDGFDVNTSRNYCIDSYKSVMEMEDARQKNEDISKQLKLVLNDVDYKVITTTRYMI